MPTPQITITGTLQDIFGAAIEGAALVFQLCGYGSLLPRVAGTSMLAGTAPERVEADANGAFSKTIYGNDVITPAGTFYTVQILNANGDIVQTAAYQFTGSGAQNLSAIAPFDPNTPAPEPPVPVVTAGVVSVPYSATPEFDASLVNGLIAFEMALTGNVDASTVINAAPGQIVSFVIIQDATGARTFTWPANVKNAGVVDAEPNAISVQSFVTRANGNLYPIGPMTVN